MIDREDAFLAWVWDTEKMPNFPSKKLVIDSGKSDDWCITVDKPDEFYGDEAYTTSWYLHHHRIPEQKKRLMTREEILGFIAWNPHIVTRINGGNALFSHGRSMLFDDLEEYEWAPITEAGEIGEWNKFEVEE